MKRVVIFGFATYDGHTADTVAPRREDGWEHWRCNEPGPTNPPIADRFFQLHERWSLDPGEERWVPKCPVPLYTFWPWDDVKDNRLYPLPQVAAMPVVPAGVVALPVSDRRVSAETRALAVADGESEIGEVRGGFFSCSFTYMIALAVLEGFEAIHLAGVELQGGSPRERLVEHAGVLWWLGYAAGRGVAVTVPASSGLLDYPFPYGYAYRAEDDFARNRVGEFLEEAAARGLCARPRRPGPAQKQVET